MLEAVWQQIKAGNVPRAFFRNDSSLSRKERGWGGLINLIHLARLTCNPNSTAVCSSRCFIISLSTSYCLSVALFLDLLEFSLGKIGTITIFFRIINFSTRIWSGSAHVPSIFGLFLFCFYFFCSFVSYTCVGNRGIECLIWSKTRGQPSVKLDQHNHFVFLGHTYSSRTTKTKRKTASRHLVSSSVDSIFKKMPSWPSKLIFHISSHGVIWQTTRLHFFVFCFCFIFLLLSMVFLMESLHVKEKSYLHISFNLLSIIPAPAKAVSMGKRRLKNHSFCLFISSDTKPSISRVWLL